VFCERRERYGHSHVGMAHPCWCGAAFAGERELLAHIFAVHAPKPSAPLASSHVKAVQPSKASGLPGHVCSTCSRVYKRKRLLARHVRESHGARKPVCRECRRVFGRRRALLRHRRGACKGRKVFECRRCKMRNVSILKHLHHKQTAHRPHHR